MKVCPSCRRENPDDAHFCSGCATSLADQGPPREERKVVSVLFCDLVGSTAQAEGLDPEDVRSLLSRYHDQVKSELERFGGTVEKFIGDAVMALFGAPVAHEDDPERSVRAALAIRDRAQDDGELQVRIGITTGEALVALGARPHAGEAMASGDVLNTAARLQSAAPENGILVDETTYRATSRVIEYGARRAVTAKGKAAPVSTWDVVQARARAHVERGGSAPLVGREKELDLLLGALRRVRDDREPQLVTLVGVPGIGKSRLVLELFEAIEAGGQLTSWRRGRSLPYGEGVSFWGLGEVVKAQAGIQETDVEDAAATKLREAVAALVPDTSEAQWLERHLRPLVGLATDDALGGDRRGEAFAAWRRFLEALAEQRPLVLVFEDLHFADDGLIDFIDYLVDWARGVPLLVVATARPELLSRKPGWGGGKANATTLSLASLSDEETSTLVQTLLERRSLPVELHETLLARAGGNPLYAEEFVRTLSERRSSAELPETVHGLIAGRIDALPADEKALLQDAAVVGRVFWLGAAADLAQIGRWTAEERLHVLERKEFVRRERRSAVTGEVEYSFHHLLVRDVAYGQVPRAVRSDKHRRAAEWLDSLGRTGDQAELLAHHYSSALELARAAGRPTAELEEATRLVLRDAGDRAFALNAYAEAVRYYEEALELGPPTDRGSLLLQLGRALSFISDERFAEVLEQAAEAFLASNDREGAAEAHAFLADPFSQRGERDLAFAHIERAVELVRDGPPSPAKVRANAELSRLLSLAGEQTEAIELGMETFEAAQSLGLVELAARALGSVASGRARLGDYVGAIADLERCIELAVPINSLEAARAWHNLHIPLWHIGELDRAVAACQEAVRIGERLGGTLQAAASRAQLPWLHFWKGDWDVALEGAEAAIAETQAVGATYWEFFPRLTRARIHFGRGMPESTVLEDVERALEIGRSLRDPNPLVNTLGHAASLFYELGLVERARATAAELVPIVVEASATGSRLLPLLANTWFAESLGLVEHIRTLLTSDKTMTEAWRRPYEAVLAGEYALAADLFGSLGCVDEGYARLRSAEQLIGEGRRAAAVEQLAKALDFFRSLGATRYIHQAEALMRVPA